MASTETDVGNAALWKIGERPVLSFDDGNDRARFLKTRFADVRDDELRSYRWSFALKRARLSALATTPAHGFSYEYAIPPDCLQMVEIDGQDVVFTLENSLAPGGAAFSLESGKILTDLSAPLNVRYVRREESVAIWDPCFVEAVACRLAVEGAEPLTQSDTKKVRATQAYTAAIKNARRMNAIERPSEGIGDSSWLLGRR